MPYRNTFLVNGNYYHIFNRGIDKQLIYKQKKDYVRFLNCLKYYRFEARKPKFSQRNKFRFLTFNQKKVIVEIVAYCLMPNHFHLLVKQVKDKGIQEFIAKLCNSHSTYFNLKYNRKGYLFESEFKSVVVETDEQLLHLSRYIHLNPHVAQLVNDPMDYSWSSCREYFKNSPEICQKETVLNNFQTLSYQDFVLNYADYAKQLHQIQHLVLE